MEIHDMSKVLIARFCVAAVSSLVGLAGCGGLPEATGEAASELGAPDFTLVNDPIEPISANIKRGSGAGFTFNIAPVNGFNGAVTFSVTGEPVATTFDFFVPQFVPSGQTPPPLTLTALTNVGYDIFTLKSGHGGPGDAGTPTGTFTLTFTATSGAISHSATDTLTIR
jgi:hypothetical protein